MKRVVLHSNSFNSFWAHYSFYRDEHFSKKFLELGYELVYSNEVDINPKDYILFFEVKSLNNLSVFFRYLNRIEKLKIILRYFFNFYKKIQLYSCLISQKMSICKYWGIFWVTLQMSWVKVFGLLNL